LPLKVGDVEEDAGAGGVVDEGPAPSHKTVQRPYSEVEIEEGKPGP